MMCFVIFKYFSPHLVPLPMGEEAHCFTLVQVWGRCRGRCDQESALKGEEYSILVPYLLIVHSHYFLIPPSPFLLVVKVALPHPRVDAPSRRFASRLRPRRSTPCIGHHSPDRYG